MNLKEIREMISLMNENELMEIEVEREGTKIKLDVVAPKCCRRTVALEHTSR